MRQSSFAVTLCAVFLLCAAPVALGKTALLHPAATHGPAMHSLVAKAAVHRAPAVYVPLARRILSGTGTISLNVYTYDSQPEVNAEADWWVWTDTDYGTGTGTTDVNGHVDLTGVPAADIANGEVAVFLDNADNGMYDLYNMSWGATGWSGGLQPGHLPVTIVRSSMTGWNSWSAARFWLYAQNAGNEVHLAATDVARTSSTTYGNARTITTGPESLTAGAVYFWNDEGMELPVSGTAVSPGTTATSIPTIYQSQAQRLWTNYWGSGKPGTTTYLVFENYPAGWVDSVFGVADYPRSATTKSFGTFSSTGPQYEGKKMTIPSTAAPGYKYWIWASHDSGPLTLQTSFQTCTLKPSRATIYGGTAIALSGIVPIKGHYGGTRGTPKYVYIYKTTSAKLARQGHPPASGGGTRAAGWTKIGRVRTDGLGKYRKGSVRPSRTTWYAVWYPGDAWYWGAWTSLAKVTVR